MKPDSLTRDFSDYNQKSEVLGIFVSSSLAPGNTIVYNSSFVIFFQIFVLFKRQSYMEEKERERESFHSFVNSLSDCND